MKHYRVYLAITALVLASLACQTVLGGSDGAPTASSEDNNPTQPQDVQPTAESNNNGGSDSTISTDFPMTADAFNVVEVGDGSIVYYTKLSMEDALKFYRDEYTARGYTEREITTVVDEASGTFSIVFDGDSSGKAVVIQSVDLGDGSRTIAIRLEDV
jgi:hypothetical protein